MRPAIDRVPAVCPSAECQQPSRLQPAGPSGSALSAAAPVHPQPDPPDAPRWETGAAAERAATCHGKAKLSHKRAVTRARKMRRTHNARLNEYRCQHCGWWHIGERLP